MSSLWWLVSLDLKEIFLLFIVFLLPLHIPPSHSPQLGRGFGILTTTPLSRLHATLVLSINLIKNYSKKFMTNKKTKQLKARQKEDGSRRTKAAGEEKQPDEVLPAGD
jgi:hypothetical protein